MAVVGISFKRKIKIVTLALVIVDLKRPNSFLQNVPLLMLISCNGYVRCKSFTTNSFQFSSPTRKKKMPQVSGVLVVCLRCLLIFVLNSDICRTLANVVLNFLLLKVSFCLEIIKECLLHFCN